jgi:hypothetical protein
MPVDFTKDRNTIAFALFLSAVGSSPQSGDYSSFLIKENPIPRGPKEAYDENSNRESYHRGK